MTSRPIAEDLAVAIAAMQAGRIDGQQAIASCAAIHARETSDRQQRIDAALAYIEHPGNWGATDGRPRLIAGILRGAIPHDSRDFGNTNLPKKETP